jgi:hypothetical protein
LSDHFLSLQRIALQGDESLSNSDALLDLLSPNTPFSHQRYLDLFYLLSELFFTQIN